MEIQAVFWDYDNTIFDTAEAHWNKHKTILAKKGIELNESFRQRIYENNGNQNWEWINKELGLKTTEKEYLKEIDDEFQRHMMKLEIRSGVFELIHMIHHLSIPQAIITNARRDSAQPVLKEREIMPFMHFVLFKEDYEGRKPDPIPYLVGFKKMMEMTGKPLDPQKCVAVEDDPKGVESAYKAGAIVIHRKLKENEINSPHAHYTCFHQEDFFKIMHSLFL